MKWREREKKKKRQRERRPKEKKNRRKKEKTKPWIQRLLSQSSDGPATGFYGPDTAYTKDGVEYSRRIISRNVYSILSIIRVFYYIPSVSLLRNILGLCTQLGLTLSASGYF